MTIELNGQKINNMEQLPSVVASAKPETDVDVLVIRDGNPQTIIFHPGAVKE